MSTPLYSNKRYIIIIRLHNMPQNIHTCTCLQVVNDYKYCQRFIYLQDHLPGIKRIHLAAIFYRHLFIERPVIANPGVTKNKQSICIYMCVYCTIIFGFCRSHSPEGVDNTVCPWSTYIIQTHIPPSIS